MARFTPHTDSDIKEMLDAIGVSSVDELFEDIPDSLRPGSFDLPAGMTEYEVYRRLSDIASMNKTDYVCFAGGGYYDHFIPAAVDAITSRSEFINGFFGRPRHHRIIGFSVKSPGFLGRKTHHQILDTHLFQG